MQKELPLLQLQAGLNNKIQLIHMFNQSKIVLTFLRKKIIACKVSMNRQKTISHVYEFGWETNTLDLIFENIQSIYHTKEVHILLSKEVYYLQKVSIPSDIEKTERRKYVLEILEERIPEVLGLNDFDFKIIGEKENEVEVLAFAPISVLTTSVKDACENTGLHVIAIEPEEVARARNTNPILGIVLKEDIEGKDEDVLNLSYKGKTHVQKDSTYKYIKPIALILFLLIVILLVFLVIQKGIVIPFNIQS